MDSIAKFNEHIKLYDSPVSNKAKFMQKYSVSFDNIQVQTVMNNLIKITVGR